jgi:hypothetical protein
MYNGVGVRTARGTGTSGHVSRNAGALRPRRDDIRRLKEIREKQTVSREVDPGIIHHNALREIEVRLVELSEQLEEEGLSESEIAERVSMRRQELRQELKEGSEPSKPSTGALDSHSLIIEQRNRNHVLASALGVTDRDQTQARANARDLAESAARNILEQDGVRESSPGRSDSGSPRRRNRDRSESSSSSRSRSRTRRY